VLLHFFKRLPYAFWLVIWLAVTVGLWFSLFPYQLNRGCWIGEWPFEQVCSDGKTSGFLTREPEKVYSSHLQHNPGNSFAYTWLALRRSKNQDVNSQSSIEAALKVAPFDAQLLAVHVNNSSNNRNWHEAAVSLIKLVEIGDPIADTPLLYLLASKEQQAFGLDLITKNSVWLDKLLKNANPKVPIQNLLPVFKRGQVLQLISAETTINFIDRLQASGHWLEAYSLWTTYQGSIKEGLFNASFDYKVSQKAFDWKWSQGPDTGKGMIVRQIPAHPNSGMLLELELVGRSAISLPMVRQNVILLGENYVFRGRYRTDKLEITDGLSWKLSCASGGEPWAQTEALLDTQKQWKKFELKLKVPGTCGAAVLVGLETKNRGEARVGISGLVQFDELSLTSEN
jgi:hypothetical protein